MNNFKTIKYIIENKLLDLSIRHLRRKAKELLSKGDTTVKLIKNSNNRNKYLIDINSLSKFQRIRAHKKIQSKCITKENDSSKKRIIKNKYDTCIAINIKSDDVAFNNTYDYDYNVFMAQTIFKKLNKNLYYFIEQEEQSINHFHLHIALERGNLSIGNLKSKIEELLYDNFNISNDDYTDRFGGNRKVLYVENMFSDYANREYLGKGTDRLGGIKPTFLSICDSYPKAS